MDQITQTHQPAIPYPLAVGGMLFASIGVGLVPYFSRGLTDQGLASHAVSFYRYILAAVLLFPFLVRSRSAWREILWGLAAGAFIGLGWVGYVTALKSVPASTVGVIYMTYPVFTLLIAWVLFKDTPSRRGLIAVGLIILGAVIAASPAAVGREHLVTLLISLAAPFGFGLGICVMVHRLSRIPPLARLASVSLGSVLGLMPLVLNSDAAEMIPRDRSDWMLVVGIGLLTALIPQLIFTICAPLIGTTRTAVSGSIELPTMFAVGVFAFGEVISPAQAVACALILGAIFLTQSRATQPAPAVMAKPA